MPFANSKTLSFILQGALNPYIMPYFDLHLHPGLKTLFLPQDGNQISAWHTIDAPTFLVGDILSSQSSLER